MKKLFYGMAAMAACSMMLLSCSSDEEGGSEEKRIVNMVADQKPLQLTEEQRVFANDNNGFTLNFLKKVNETDHSGRSFIYSPLSITYVLGMVNDAATGNTEKELEETLGFHEGGIQAVNDYCKNLIDNLPKADEDVELDIANAIFLNKDYTLKPQFEEDMAYYYDAKAEALDFSSSKTLSHINDWCKKQTKGMIPSILDEVNPEMVSYLLNAIYFKADWTNKFDPKNTKNEKFETGKGSTEMPMMRQDVYISYVKNETYSAVKIPYGNSLWNMVVMLPEEGKTTDDIVNRLAENGFSDVEDYRSSGDGVFKTYEVDLKLPRFETSSDTKDLEGGLISLLQQMGIRQAFDKEFAEIPNMCNKLVYIEMMRQKAKIKVNEEGSEAAAVTVAGMAELTSAGPSEEEVIPKATFHANRPFVYVIREMSSGVILFVGKYTGKS
ncbi:MAG: serpin family protein [Bacteroidales bacterium]|nr:serpin family protein [Bacteroidales bacterium]